MDPGQSESWVHSTWCRGLELLDFTVFLPPVVQEWKYLGTYLLVGNYTVERKEHSCTGRSGTSLVLFSAFLVAPVHFYFQFHVHVHVHVQSHPMQPFLS